MGCCPNDDTYCGYQIPLKAFETFFILFKFRQAPVDTRRQMRDKFIFNYYGIDEQYNDTQRKIEPDNARPGVAMPGHILHSKKIFKIGYHATYNQGSQNGWTIINIL